jgi:hypothetical protein
MIRNILLTLGFLWAINANAADLNEAYIADYHDIEASQNGVVVKTAWTNNLGQAVYITRVQTVTQETGGYTGVVLSIIKDLSKSHPDGAGGVDGGVMQYGVQRIQTPYGADASYTFTDNFAPDSWMISPGGQIQIVSLFSSYGPIPSGQAIGTMFSTITYRLSP